MLLFSGLVVLGAGFMLQPLVLKALTARAIYDVPNERSSHTVPTPRGGGIAIVMAATAGILLHPPARLFAVPLLFFAAIGLAEDVRGVPIARRFGLQLAAGLVAAFLVLPDGLGTAEAVAAICLGAGWLTTYVNAFNFMDGINGISAAHAILTGAVYATIGGIYDMPGFATASIAAVAASATFLPWNAGRARMFLGDVGAYALGGLLATLAAYAVLRGVPVEAVLAPLALYLADTGWALAKRFCRGGAWYLAHREHVYQRLTDGGWSHHRVTITTVAVSAGISVGALVSANGGPVGRVGMGMSIAAVLIAYLGVPGWRARHRKHAVDDHRRVNA